MVGELIQPAGAPGKIVDLPWKKKDNSNWYNQGDEKPVAFYSVSCCLVRGSILSLSWSVLRWSMPFDTFRHTYWDPIVTDHGDLKHLSTLKTVASHCGQDLSKETSVDSHKMQHFYVWEAPEERLWHF